MKMTVQSYFSIVPNLMKIHSFYVSLFFSCFLIVYYCLAFCLLESSIAVTLGFFGVALIFGGDGRGLLSFALLKNKSTTTMILVITVNVFIKSNK